MSFLDNLENNLKALESRDERASVRPSAAAEADKKRARATQPYAEQLRSSAFTKALMDQTVTQAHALRTKVYINWSGNALRLDARDHRLELQPTPDGIQAVFSSGLDVIGREPVSLDGDAADLARRFLARLN